MRLVYQNPAVVKTITSETAVQTPALRSLPHGHSFLLHGRRIQVPHLTGRNPITFPFSTSETTPALHSQSLIPTQTLTSPPDYCSLPGWDSRYLLASHSTHRTHSWSAKNPQRLLEDVIKLQTLEFFLRGSNSTLFSMVSQSITLL